MNEKQAPKPTRNQANLLLSNVQLTMARMLLTIGFGLATIRFVLKELGEVDYGIFSVVGASMFVVAAIKSTLASSTQRHLAYEVGRGGQGEIKEVFSTSMLMAIGLAAFVLTVGMIFGRTIISFLTIPIEKEDAALEAFRYTVLSASTLILAAPYSACLLARQNFLVPAFFAVVFSLISFGGAILLPWLDGNSLSNYSMIQFINVLVTSVGMILFSCWTFPDSRFRYRFFKKRLVAPLVSFGGWAGLGALGWQMRTHGVQVIGNVTFGPTFNAAFGIAQQISGYASTLPSTIIRVVSPAMTQMIGKGNLPSAIKLRDLASRVCPLLTLLLVGPLVIELEQVLNLWIVAPPKLAMLFAIFLLINLTVDHSASGHGIMFTATGEIKWYSVFTFVNVLLQLGFALLLTKYLSMPAWSILLVLIIGTAFNLLFKVAFDSENGFQLQGLVWWARTVFSKVLITGALAATGGIFIMQTMKPTPYRICAVTLVHSTILISLAATIVLDRAERVRVSDFLFSLVRKFK